MGQPKALLPWAGVALVRTPVRPANGPPANPGVPPPSTTLIVWRRRKRVFRTKPTRVARAASGVRTPARPRVSIPASAKAAPPRSPPALATPCVRVNPANHDQRLAAISSVNVDQPVSRHRPSRPARRRLAPQPIVVNPRFREGALWRRSPRPTSVPGPRRPPPHRPRRRRPRTRRCRRGHPGPPRRRHPPPPPSSLRARGQSQLAVLNLNTPADYAAAQPSGGPAPSPKLSAGP